MVLGVVRLAYGSRGREDAVFLPSRGSRHEHMHASHPIKSRTLPFTEQNFCCGCRGVSGVLGDEATRAHGRTHDADERPRRRVTEARPVGEIQVPGPSGPFQVAGAVQVARARKEGGRAAEAAEGRWR
jgi:hypothetical protein